MIIEENSPISAIQINEHPVAAREDKYLGSLESSRKPSLVDS